jgi:hypothetical protein
VLDLRLYRVTLLPFAALLAVAAFSLHARPPALSSSPPPQSFSAEQVLSQASTLAALHPNIVAGSPGDDALAGQIASGLAPCRLSDADCSVRIVTATVDTTAGTRTIRTVIASRAGSGGGIVLIADRGGGSPATPASLAPTAILEELALLYRDVAVTNTLTFVSTSGGPSAMGAVAAELPPGTEAAIVIGDVADAAGRGPYVVPWSQSGALAPIELRRSVEAALAGALSRPVQDPPLADQVARLALPLTTGAQGLLGAAGVPAVLIGTAGEGVQRSNVTPSATLVGEFGQALLGLTRALDGGPQLPAAPTRDLAVGTQVLDGWAVRAVIGGLLLSLLVCALDVLARARRRRAQVGGWVVWVLSCAAPFLLAGIFAAFLGAGGLLPATPLAAVTPAELPVTASGIAALASVGLLFVLAWVLHAAVTARSRCKGPPEPVGATAALLLTGTGVAALLWLANPYTAALVVLPLHLWLVTLTREAERPLPLSLAYLVLSLAPFAAALAVVCVSLHTEPLALTWTLVLLAAGGGLSPYGLILASLSAGLFVAAAATLLRARAQRASERVEVTVRGPLTYAGPGSLGGTPSALRR